MMGAVAPRTWIGALVAVALIVRLVLVIATPHYYALTDAREFDNDAVTLVRDGSFPSSPLTARGGPTAFRPPLFPIALAAVYELVGTGSAKDRWEAGRVLEAVLGAIAVALICLIALRLFGVAPAVVAGAIAAVYPPLVLAGSSLLSESLFIPLVLGALLAALVHRDSGRQWRWAVLSGVLIGLAALTRGNGIFLVLPLIFLVWTRQPRLSWQAFRAPFAVLAAAIVILIPWTIRNYSVFHRFVPITTETGYILAGTYNAAIQYQPQYPALWYLPVAQMQRQFAADPGANESQVSSRLTSDGLSYIEHHPGSLLRTGYWSTLRLLDLTGTRLERIYAFPEGYPLWLATLSVYVFWVVLALSIAGAFTLAARRAPRALWAFPGLIVLSTMFLEGDTRYRLPADPFCVMLVALALVSFARRLRAMGVAR